MNEEEKPKTEPDGKPKPEGKPEEKIDEKLSPEGTEKVDENESMDKIDKANEAAERLERANKKHEELILKQEKIAVNDALGGKSELSEKETPADKQKAASKALLPDGMECPGVTD